MSASLQRCILIDDVADATRIAVALAYSVRNAMHACMLWYGNLMCSFTLLLVCGGRWTTLHVYWSFLGVYYRWLSPADRAVLHQPEHYSHSVLLLQRCVNAWLCEGDGSDGVKSGAHVVFVQRWMLDVKLFAFPYHANDWTLMNQFHWLSSLIIFSLCRRYLVSLILLALVQYFYAILLRTGLKIQSLSPCCQWTKRWRDRNPSPKGNYTETITSD